MVRKSLGWSGAELNTKMPAGAYTVSSEEVRLRDPLHLLTCLLASAASVAVVAVAALRSLHICTPRSARFLPYACLTRRHDRCAARHRGGVAAHRGECGGIASTVNNIRRRIVEGPCFLPTKLERVVSRSPQATPSACITPRRRKHQRRAHEWGLSFLPRSPPSARASARASARPRARPAARHVAAGARRRPG